MGKELDLVGLCKYVWSKKRFLAIVTVCGIVVGIIIAVGLPKEYTSKAKLLPLQQKGEKDRNASMASMIGLSFATSSLDNLSVGLYSEILKSNSFLIGLADMKVKPSDLPEMTLYDYLVKNQRRAWWTKVLDFSSWFSSSEKDSVSKAIEWDVLYLTPQQQNYINQLNRRIVAWEDKTSGLLNIEVLMQDPVVSATVVNVLIDKLRESLFLIKKRKLESDLHYMEKMYDEAKHSYNVLEQQKDILNERQLEMEASMSLCNMIARQYELLQVEVDDERPMFSVIDSARVPIDFSSPNRQMIVFVFAFLSLFGSIAWVILRRLFESE